MQHFYFLDIHLCQFSTLRKVNHINKKNAFSFIISYLNSTEKLVYPILHLKTPLHNHTDFP